MNKLRKAAQRVVDAGEAIRIATLCLFYSGAHSFDQTIDLKAKLELATRTREEAISSLKEALTLDPVAEARDKVVEMAREWRALCAEHVHALANADTEKYEAACDRYVAAVMILTAAIDRLDELTKETR